MRSVELRLLLLLALAPGALAATRARFGGTLKVALAQKQGEFDPLWADTPSEAALVGLSSRSVCRLDRSGGALKVLVSELSRPSPTQLRLTLRENLRLGDGTPLAARQLAQSLERVANSPSPYRALLFPLRGEGRQLSAASSQVLELSLSFPWPDLERALCHPALALGVGPFRRSGERGSFAANPAFPEGRPYADALTVTSTDERGAARLLSLRRAQLALGGAEDGSPSGAPALYGTYLAFQKKLGADFRQALESAIDRADLTRYFVRAPAVPMARLLPPVLHPGAETPRPPAPRAQSPARELALLYDQSLPDQRAVAERLQLKLFERGYRVALRGLPRQQLRAAWAAGEYELLLHSLLLPPSPPLALAIALEAAGRRELLSLHLPALGAIADPAARDARARELADALAPELELFPLYAQALQVSALPGVNGLTLDPQGLPALEELFLGEVAR